MERSDIRGRSRLFASLKPGYEAFAGMSGGWVYSGDTSFSPTIPATISPMQASRSAAVDSPNR
jgi:hypothetical protein